MLWFSLSMLACSPDAPPVEPVAVVVETLPGRVRLTLPDSLSPSGALDLAAFHAAVADLDGWVFDVGPVRSQAHRYALTDEDVSGSVSMDGDTLPVSVCRPTCRAFTGEAGSVAEDVATLLNGAPPVPWELPTGKSLRYASQSARILYGFDEPVARSRIGSRRDPVARAPREEGATLLTSWMQGQRDVQIGRAVPGAQALQTVARERHTRTATYDMAGAYAAAGWPDEAWDAVRDTPQVDLRFRALYGHIAHQRGRTDEGLRVVAGLPDHPETHRLAYLLEPSSETVNAWRTAAPNDASAWNAAWTEAMRSGDQDAVDALGKEAPDEGAPSTMVMEVVQLASTLDDLLTTSERVARETAVLQNRFGERRAEETVVCADEAMRWVDEAYRLGAEHRDLVQQSREPHSRLETLLGDQQLKSALGDDFGADLAALDARFDAQMRSSKVIRAYHERILLARICPDRS
jgi:hypothetical protein